MEILVIHKGGIGDVVFGLPLLFDLKQGFPGSRLTVLTHRDGAQVLQFFAPVDHLLTLSDERESWSLKSARATLESRRFDVAVCTARSLRAAWLLRQLKIPVRAGFGGGPERVLYTHVAPSRPFEVLFSKRFQRLSLCLGLKAQPRHPALTVSEAELSRARKMLVDVGWDGVRPLVAVHVGGGWPTKQWPVEHIAELIRRLSSFQVVLQGGRDDAPRVQALRGLGAIDTTSDSIADAIAKAPLYSACVGIDSGLSHATAACGVPTVFLFGPNNPDSILLGPRQQMLLNDLPCRPCNRRGRFKCPEGHHRCMKDHVPAVVQNALSAVMATAAVG